MHEQPIKVLLIEDNPGDAVLIKDDLKGNSIRHASSLKEGLNLLNQENYDIVLLDLNLPDSSYISTVKSATENNNKGIPVIVMTGVNSADIGMQSIHLGAEDYLVKGRFDEGLLKRSIQYSIERNKLKKELLELSIFDELTGLYNRRGFKVLGEQQLKEAKRSNCPIMVFLVDLDKMKQINDQYGHKAGDLALIDAANILRKSFRNSDIISRWGGDEFVILCLDATQENAVTVKQRLGVNIRKHNTESGREYQLSMTVGETFRYYEPDIDLENLIRDADQSMYRQKKGGPA